MAAIVRPMRQRPGSRRGAPSDLADLFKDGRVWVQRALVARPGSEPHWFKEDGDIFVHVETVPRGLDLTCRLGAAFGSMGFGGWRVPAVGTEVLVAIPDGETDWLCTIIGCEASGAAPARAGVDRTLLVAPDVIEVQAPKAVLGPDGSSATQGVVVQQDSVKLGGEAATQPIMQGDLLASALLTMAAAINTYAIAIKPVADPSNAATHTLTTALTTALTAGLSAAKSTVSKTR